MTTDPPLYTRHYVQVLLGATLTMIGVSMQFHFGEFVEHIGYGVDTLGRIIGVGFVGGLLLRPVIGRWIDRVGCRPCFLTAGALGAVVNVSFLLTDSLLFVYVARMALGAANAIFLTTVAVYAAKVAPTVRRAESLGTIGIGGFIGMMIGPAIGDAIFERTHGVAAFQTFFLLGAGMNLLAAAVVSRVPSPEPHKHFEFPSFAALLRQYWPGTTLLVPIMLAAILSVHMTFLERYAEFRSFQSIRFFYFAYAPTAILIRLALRDFPQRFGRRRTCVTGLLLLALGLCVLTQVRAEWSLLIPAVIMGAGHALTFPSMVDLIAERLPNEYRGVGTSIALGGMDIGFFGAGYLWGYLIKASGYNATFLIAALGAASVAVIFGVSQRGQEGDAKTAM